MKVVALCPELTPTIVARSLIVEYGRITSVESEYGAYAVCSTVVLQ